MLTEEQIKAALAKYNDKTKLGTDEEAAAAAKHIILELGRLALGLPADRENKAADKATLHILGKWKSENPGLSFWESFFSRFAEDPDNAIKYLNQRREDKSVRMAKVRKSEKRNRPKASMLEIEALLSRSPSRDSNKLWHALRKAPSVNQNVTSGLPDKIVFNDGEIVLRGTFRQRVARAKKRMAGRA
jgi:hypothetical protein